MPAPAVMMGQPVIAPPPPFNATDLIGGNALVAPVIDPEAAQLLTENNFDLFARHLAHLEQTEHLTLTILRDLGLARGIHLLQEPTKTIGYLQDMLFLDAMPEMTDPGAQGVLPDGTPIQARALVHALRGVVTQAKDILDAARDTSPPGGLATGVATAVATAIRDTDAKKGRVSARVMPPLEIQEMKNDFRNRHHFEISDHEHGDARSFGKAELYCKDQGTYPGKDAMDWLKVYSGDGHVPEGGKGLKSDGATVTVESLDPAAMEATNATTHVEAYTRKMNTILLVIGEVPIKAGQTSGGSTSPTLQLGLDDVLQVGKAKTPPLPFSSPQ